MNRQFYKFKSNKSLEILKWERNSVRSFEDETMESNRLKSGVPLLKWAEVVSSKETKISENLTAPTNFFSVEEARIHAHLCGDGCVWREYRKRTPSDLRTHKRRNIFREYWWLNYTNTIAVLRNEFKKDFMKAFQRKLLFVHGIDLRTGSVKNILFRLNLLGKNSYNWYIPEEVMSNSRTVKANWLRAFFDDETTVDLQRKTIRLKIVNCIGLLQIQKLLNDLAIKSNITGPNIDNTWCLNVRHSEILKFNRVIGFNHPKQKFKLKKLVKMIS